MRIREKNITEEEMKEIKRALQTLSIYNKITTAEKEIEITREEQETIDNIICKMMEKKEEIEKEVKEAMDKILKKAKED